MTAKLVSITFVTEPRLPGFRPLTRVEVDKMSMDGQLKGWRIYVRGAAVVFMSPPGWAPGLAETQWDANGARTLYEIPRANCYLAWSGDESDVDALAKYTPVPMDPVPVRATTFGVAFDASIEQAKLADVDLPISATVHGLDRGIDPDLPFAEIVATAKRRGRPPNSSRR